MNYEIIGGMFVGLFLAIFFGCLLIFWGLSAIADEIRNASSRRADVDRVLPRMEAN